MREGRGRHTVCAFTRAGEGREEEEKKKNRERETAYRGKRRWCSHFCFFFLFSFRLGRVGRYTVCPIVFSSLTVPVSLSLFLPSDHPGKDSRRSVERSTGHAPRVRLLSRRSAFAAAYGLSLFLLRGGPATLHLRHCTPPPAIGLARTLKGAQKHTTLSAVR